MPTNPVIVMDETDKASADAQYGPLGALYSLLEHDTARKFMGEFAEIAIDASQVIWTTTANDPRSIHKPILNRTNVYEMEPPSCEAARHIACNLYQSFRTEHGWGERFAPDPHSGLQDTLAELAPRQMRRALMTGFGNARLNGRDTVWAENLPKASPHKGCMGFMQ